MVRNLKKLSGAELRKVLFVNTKSSVWGGVERYIQAIVPIISGAGYSVSALFEEKPDYEDGFTEVFSESLYLEDIERTVTILKSMEIDAVFIHKIESPALLRSLQSSFKTVFFVHDHDYYCFRRHKYFPLTRNNCSLPNNFIYCSVCSGMINKVFGKISPVNVLKKQKMFNLVKNSNHFIVLSGFMKKNLEKNGVSGEKISKIYPVKEAVSEKNTKERGNILFAGQMVRGKGFDLLLEALSKVKKDFHLDVIGKGDDEERISGVVDKYGLKNKITFNGWINNPSDFFQKCSFVVFPSKWQEPFGLVGIEAFSYSKPVIAFNVGGVSEWLVDGENGFIIEPFDTVKMAGKIEMLIDDNNLAEKMGKNGLELIKEKYLPQKFIVEFEKMMEKLSV